MAAEIDGRGERTVRKRHGEFQEATLPDGLFLSRDATFPVLQIQNSLLGARGLRIEGKGMISAPLLSAPVLANNDKNGLIGGESAAHLSS